MCRLITIGVVDGPFDTQALAHELARPPVMLRNLACSLTPGTGCSHGTFIMGLLGARSDATVPGLCPEACLLVYPIFPDIAGPTASVGELADAIERCVRAGADIINLSLSIIGGDPTADAGLSSALDLAWERGVIVVVAVGNHGQLAGGQILSHPATIPVSAIDPEQRLLPKSNFGSMITRRGIAALGHEVRGYGPNKQLVTMSGTSVAAAMASGTIAAVWHVRASARTADIREAIELLAPGLASGLPNLTYDCLLQSLESVLRDTERKLPGFSLSSFTTSARDSFMTNYEVPADGDKFSRNRRSAFNPALVAPFGRAAVAPAAGTPEQACSCHQTREELSGFVYAIGTIVAEPPSLAIERELQALASHFGMAGLVPAAAESRAWLYAILSADRKMTRYIARQLSWRLTVEDYPAFVLSPRDPADFDDMIDCLERPLFPPVDARARSDFTFTEPTHSRDLDVVIGVPGAETPDGVIVKLDQVFTINPGQFNLPDGRGSISQIGDNFGLTDEDRAYNFVLARYAVEEVKLKEIGKDFELSAVSTIRSRLGGGGRRVIRVIYTFSGKGRAAPLQRRYFVRVDVTDEFPFIATPWSLYLEHGALV